MRKSWNDFMKMGIVHFMAYPGTIKGVGPVLETIEKLLDDAFFTAIEVSWIKDDSVRQKVRDLLEKSGKVVAFGGQPPLLVNKLSLCSLDDQEREKAISQSKASIDEACFLGAKGVAVLSGRFEGENSREEQTEKLMDSLNSLCSYAESKGNLAVSLEPFDRSIGKNCLIGPTEEAIKVAQRIRSEHDNFGLLLDLSHLPLLSEGIHEALNMAKDYLTHVHIGNCVMKDEKHPAYGDEHPIFGIEEGENGVEELTEFLRTLMEIGYLDKANPRIVSFEVKPFGDQTSEEVIEKSKDIFKKAWQNV